MHHISLHIAEGSPPEKLVLAAKYLLQRAEATTEDLAKARGYVRRHTVIASTVEGEGRAALTPAELELAWHALDLWAQGWPQQVRHVLERLMTGQQMAKAVQRSWVFPLSVPVWSRLRRHLTSFADSLVQWLTAGKAPTAAYVSPSQKPQTYPETAQNVFGRAARLGMTVAPQTPLTPTERYAMRYAQHHAGSKLRGLFTGLNERLETALLEHERQAVQQRVPVALLQRQGPDALASALAHVQETFLRDWRRVARTELVEAHNQGAVASLIARHPSQAGVATPEIPQILVYKIPRVNACTHCKRIWIGADGAPRLYPLAEVLANGTNEGRKAEDWRAVPGVVHPNCTEGALLEYTPAVELVFTRMRQEQASRTA